ncbi:lamin-B2-like [Gouania willdenowi]|uniref:lamin-B2-like n=1 Tax=Gouania willdenowi TaxID=441366 RepID=UPI001054E4AF|nr:lamin-B2-like [Gouania willdenowi]
MGTTSATPSRSAVTAPQSPALISRLQEKHNLQNLNDRLAKYIGSVRDLELQKDRLMVQVSKKKEGATRKLTDLKVLYDLELFEIRRLLDHTAQERASFLMAFRKVKTELDETTASVKKKDEDRVAAMSRAEALESQLNMSEAALATAQSQNAALTAELAEVNKCLIHREYSHAVAKCQLKEQFLMRVNLENRCQSMREELEFRKSAFEEELRESQRQQEQSTLVANSVVRQNCEFKLAQSIQDLRKQQNEQISLYKEELEHIYQAKLYNAMGVTKISDKAMSTAREELQESRMITESFQHQLSALQIQVTAYEDKIRELEDTLSAETDKHRRAIEGKEVEMSEMRDRTYAQLSDYRELLDVKLGLDLEIIGYRNLLEGGISRLKQSPSPSSQVSVSIVKGSSPRHSPKRKRIEFEAEDVAEKHLDKAQLLNSKKATSSLKIPSSVLCDTRNADRSARPGLRYTRARRR